MSTNPNTVKSQDDLIKKAFENQNDDLIKNALNSGYIKSQDDLNPCNDGKRSSDVLLSTIKELEKTKKQLVIAKEALHLYKNLRGDGTLTNYQSIAINALEEIGCLELDYMELNK